MGKQKTQTKKSVGSDVERCICEWPDSCGGTGEMECEGCGGDQCVCHCGGVYPCFGCPACEE